MPGTRSCARRGVAIHMTRRCGSPCELSATSWPTSTWRCTASRNSRATGRPSGAARTAAASIAAASMLAARSSGIAPRGQVAVCAGGLENRTWPTGHRNKMVARGSFDPRRCDVAVGPFLNPTGHESRGELAMHCDRGARAMAPQAIRSEDFTGKSVEFRAAGNAAGGDLRRRWREAQPSFSRGLSRRGSVRSHSSRRWCEASRNTRASSGGRRAAARVS